MATEGIQTLFRIRVVNRITGVEITNDLAHLHTSEILVQAMQPGNPSASALGSFRVNLHPPGSEGFAAAKAVYDQLDRYLRLEFYASHDGVSLGKLYFAGPITGINKVFGLDESSFTLVGVSDLQWAYTSVPFPGEVITGHGTTGSLQQFQDFLGINSLAVGDAFNPFTAGNYTSSNIPTQTAGTWGGATDDGLTDVACNSTSGATGAALISKSNSSASDPEVSYYVEISGRLQPSANTGNAGQMGVGVSKASTDPNSSAIGYAQAKWNATTSTWDLNAGISVFIASVLTSVTFTNVLTNIGDAEGFVPLTVGLLTSYVGANATHRLTINGAVIGSFTSLLDLAGHGYPLAYFGASNTGFSQANFANLLLMIRQAGPGLPSNLGVFLQGTVGTPVHALPAGSTPAPTHLEVWSQVATREGWYWRYTPKAYVTGSAGLGTVDLTNDPGADLTTSVVFDRSLGNLIALQLNDNADRLASSTVGNGQAATDSGGLAFWRDIIAMQTYGVIQDQVLATMPSDFATLRKSSYWAMKNKLAIGIGGAKTITVLRDSATVDKWRELDKITVNDPEMGINNLTARVIAYTFTENSPYQIVTLDQFAENDLRQTLTARRWQTSMFKLASAFKSR